MSKTPKSVDWGLGSLWRLLVEYGGIEGVLGTVFYSIRTRGRRWVADVTFVEQCPFLLASVPLRFPGNGYSPKYGTFPEVMKIDIGGIGGGKILVDIPSATSTSREPREVHLWGRSILDHRTETDQGSGRMNIRRIFKRQGRNLCRNMSVDSSCITISGHSLVGWNPVYGRQWRNET